MFWFVYVCVTGFLGLAYWSEGTAFVILTLSSVSSWMFSRHVLLWILWFRLNRIVPAPKFWWIYCPRTSVVNRFLFETCIISESFCFPSWFLARRVYLTWHVLVLVDLKTCQYNSQTWFYFVIFDLVLTRIMFIVCGADVSLDADATRKLLRVQRHIQVELCLNRIRLLAACISITIWAASIYHIPFVVLFSFLLIPPRWFTLRTDENCLSLYMAEWFVHLSLQYNDKDNLNGFQFHLSLFLKWDMLLFILIIIPVKRSLRLREGLQFGKKNKLWSKLGL